MKKLLVFTILFITTAFLNAQETYFHELRGMEDSTGTTQLFYRLFVTDSEPVEPETCCFNWTNHVTHYDTFVKSDSVVFESVAKPAIFSPGIGDDFTDDYLFVESDLSKPFWLSNRNGSWSNQYSYDYSYNGSFFHTGHNWGNKIGYGKNDTLSFFTKNFKNESALVVLDNDSLPSIEYPYAVLVKANPEEEYCDPSENCFLGASDSVRFLSYNFLEINPYNSKNIYLTRNDSLFITQDLGNQVKFLNASFEWSAIGSLKFSQDNSVIMAISENRFLVNGQNIRYPNYRLLRSLDEGYNWSELTSDTSRIYVSGLADNEPYDNFFIGIDTILYGWNQLSSRFSEVQEFKTPITGIYQKPGFDLFYVLTMEELFQVENGVTTSLKKLPLSNEEEPKVILNSIVLHQNYPNPFNPSTTISFELDSPAEITLTVFDALGRTISVLVNEQRHLGPHQITFDASNLSSGIYFYRLETENFIETKRLTLIK